MLVDEDFTAAHKLAFDMYVEGRLSLFFSLLSVVLCCLFLTPASLDCI